MGCFFFEKWQHWQISWLGCEPPQQPTCWNCDPPVEDNCFVHTASFLKICILNSSMLRCYSPILELSHGSIKVYLNWQQLSRVSSHEGFFHNFHLRTCNWSCWGQNLGSSASQACALPLVCSTSVMDWGCNLLWNLCRWHLGQRWRSGFVPRSTHDITPCWGWSLPSWSCPSFQVLYKERAVQNCRKSQEINRELRNVNVASTVARQQLKPLKREQQTPPFPCLA